MQHVAYTTEADAMLASILANPADDGLRLIYADWLDERAEATGCSWCGGSGERHGLLAAIAKGPRKCVQCGGTGSVSNGNAERAEFIRVQCELANHRLTKANQFHHATIGKIAELKAWEDLRRRERELLNDASREKWFKIPGLGVQLGSDGQPPVWWIQPGGPQIFSSVSRGFVHSITLTAADFLTHAEAIFRQQPVTKVTLSDKRPDVLQFAPENMNGHAYWTDETLLRPFGEPNNRIPHALMAIMEPEAEYPTFSQHESPQAAMEALSAACARFGRRAAGLSDLTTGG